MNFDYHKLIHNRHLHYLNIDEFPDLNKKVKHDISIIVDRIILNSNLGNRLADSVETAVNLSDGLLIVEYENETLPKKLRKRESITFSSKRCQFDDVSMKR